MFTFLSQLNEEENREDIAASPEGSTSGSDGEQAPEQEDDSPKVDVTN
jgi:hypothetical protein